MKHAILLGILAALALAGCSNGQDVGDANKPPPAGAKLAPPPSGAGGPATPTQQVAK